jgi:hypothetical protein
VRSLCDSYAFGCALISNFYAVKTIFAGIKSMVPVMSTLITGIRWLLAGVSFLRHEIAETLADTYRPEMHYMRGPGPKWREKHGFVLGASNHRR